MINFWMQIRWYAHIKKDRSVNTLIRKIQIYRFKKKVVQLGCQRADSTPKKETVDIKA